MRMSDEEYFRSCVAKERHLAQLLGHHNIEEFYESAGTLWEDTHVLPQWTRDWLACGRLMTEYDITVTYHKEPGELQSSSATVGPIHVHFSDHPTKEQAVRYAIVKAVTHLLEHARVHKH
jgi:hypothetical protein